MDDATGDSPTIASELSGAGALVAGRYRVRARLGRGASKEVFLAYDSRLDREVALAMVVGGAGTTAGRARVEREARVTGRLGDHPNVVTAYDTGEVDGVPYLVLRAMRRGSLADALDHERPTVAEAVRIARDVAAALAHAHAHGVVHRDVKPDNVWLAEDGAAALGDFGVAHEIGADRLTAEGVVVGTVRYVSPEQIRGEEAGPPSDLYALGVTLYELLAGRPPFVAHDAAAVFAQHLTVAPAPPSEHTPGLPRALDALVLALLAKDPRDRPPSATAVAEALDDLAGDRRPATTPPQTARRVIAVLTVRLDGADPEVLHGALDRCAAVVERHGGTVEHHLGASLTGLFGVAEARGDEAVRAARAAVELRAATAGLRLGIEAGEVFVAAGARGDTTVTGTAITEAGRLADAAAPGEIRLGDAARSTVAADARVADGGLLLGLHDDVPALLRGPPTAFVDRTAELAQLQAAFARARDERACHLVTVTGVPGIGKSRLAGVLLAGLGEHATVLAGQCPAYGEGTTYRPLRDLVRGLGGDDPRARVEKLLDGDDQAVHGLLGALGIAGEPAHLEETSWALRRLLERVARDRPLVVAIEDIHWADDALLDVVDHVVTLSGGAPILLVCLARPELLERRPAWAAPGPRRSLVALDALPSADARDLAVALGAPAQEADRIVRRAEGNALFVEQLVAVQPGPDDLPVSIQAVLAARIDGLDPGERTLLQRAAVEGRTFHIGALDALLGDHAPGARTRLVALARKGLIGGDEAQHPGEDAFRFTHALIREAAYAGLPKRRRAELHAALADWLEGRPGAADEVVAHHLEQACRLAAELGTTEPAPAARAAGRLRAAARAALDRGDPAAAAALLQRAVDLPALADPIRSTLLPDLGAALFQAGHMDAAARVLDEGVAAAATPGLRARAQVERELLALETDPAAGAARAAQVAAATLAVLTADGDEPGQARAWTLRAHAAWTAGRVGDADAAWEQAAGLAGRGGDERERFAILTWRATAAVLGPTPVPEAIARCEAFRDEVAASPVAVASMVNPLASLHAMRGDQALAEEHLRQANETLARLGSLGASVSHHEALVRLLAGEPARAEGPLRDGVTKLEAMGDGGLLATTTAMLAQAVLAQDRPAEAAELCRRTAAGAAADDIVTQAIWRSVLARVHAGEGRCEEASALAREAVALLAPTDLLSHHADAMLDLAEVLWTCSRTQESVGAARTALALYEQKGNVVGAARARALPTRRSRET